MKKVCIEPIFPNKSDYPQKLNLLGAKQPSNLYRQLLESSASAYFETNLITRYFFRKRFHLALQLIPRERTNLEVLDAGSGIGFFLPALSMFSKNIWAVDYAQHSLTYAEHMCKKRKLKKVHFKQVDLTGNLSFAAKRFDLIICLSVLEHIKDLDKVLSNFKGVLKTDGVLIIGYPNEDNLIFRIFQYLEKRLFRPRVFTTLQGTRLIHVSRAHQINSVVKKYFRIEETKNINLLPGVSFYILQKCRSFQEKQDR